MATEDMFIEAIKEGDLAQVERLIDQLPDLLQRKVPGDFSPALLAMYYNEPEVAQLLVQRGAPLDLFAASGCGALEQVQALVEAEPGLVEAVAADGFQPLGLAAFFGQVEVVHFLLERGAAVDSPSHNPMRVMPLHSAAANRHLEICRLLLEHGAPVNATQADDFTPLHEAAQNGQIELVRLLLDYGAEVNAHKSDGQTPLALAIEYGHPEVAEVLKSRGAVL
jgi:ankyrin repeat protein